MFKKLKTRSKRMAEKEEVRSKVHDARQKIEAASRSTKIIAQKAGDKFDEGKLLLIETIDKHWVNIEKVVLDGMLEISEEKLQDDDWLISLFEKAYEMLPMAARLTLQRDKFIAFCMERKGLIVNKIIDYLVDKSDNIPPNSELPESGHDGIDPEDDSLKN
jgi:hypothetical protein